MQGWPPCGLKEAYGGYSRRSGLDAGGGILQGDTPQRKDWHRSRNLAGCTECNKADTGKDGAAGDRLILILTRHLTEDRSE